MENRKFSNTEERIKLVNAVRNGEIRNILLFRCQKLGDMLTFLPSVLCIRDIFPTAQLTLACRKDGLAIAGRIPYIHTILVDDLENTGAYRSAFDLMVTSSQDAGWIRLKKKLKIRFAVGVLSESLRGVCLKHRWQYRYFTDVERYSDSEHDVARNLKVPRLLGRTDCSHLERTLWITSSEKKAVLDLLRNNEPRPLVVVSPSGSKSSKNWRPDYFASLCDALIRELGVRIAIIGKGKLAREQADRMLKGMKEKALSFVDRTSFGEVCAFIERSDLVVSVDSGTAHIASYLNRPLVVIFGPGDAEQWGPWHADASRGIMVKTPCACGTTLYKCRAKRHCLDAITPDEVFRKAVDLLSREKSVSKGNN